MLSSVTLLLSAEAGAAQIQSFKCDLDKSLSQYAQLIKKGLQLRSSEKINANSKMKIQKNFKDFSQEFHSCLDSYASEIQETAVQVCNSSQQKERSIELKETTGLECKDVLFFTTKLNLLVRDSLLTGVPVSIENINQELSALGAWNSQDRKTIMKSQILNALKDMMTNALLLEQIFPEQYNQDQMTNLLSPLTKIYNHLENDIYL